MKFCVHLSARQCTAGCPKSGLNRLMGFIDRFLFAGPTHKHKFTDRIIVKLQFLLCMLPHTRDPNIQLGYQHDTYVCRSTNCESMAHRFSGLSEFDAGGVGNVKKNFPGTSRTRSFAAEGSYARQSSEPNISPNLQGLKLTTLPK